MAETGKSDLIGCFSQYPPVARVPAHPADFKVSGYPLSVKQKNQMFGRQNLNIHISVVPCPDPAQAERFFLENPAIDGIHRITFPFDRQPFFSLAKGRFSEKRPRA